MGPKRVTTGSNWAKHTYLGIPSDPGTTLKIFNFDPHLITGNQILRPGWTGGGGDKQGQTPSF